VTAPGLAAAEGAGLRCLRNPVSVVSVVSGGGNQVLNLVPLPAQPPCLGNECTRNGHLSRTEDSGDFGRFRFCQVPALVATLLTRSPMALVLG